MTIHFDKVPAGSTLYVPFTTYGGTDGESVTVTGLAVTDIEIYKNGSTTQRASDAGYSLLDTDGIDFDGITGLHGFSIDLSDNTDSGFYAVGSFYWVVVSAVTVDSQTVSFVAATFRIGPAEASTGYDPVTIKPGTGTGEINLSSGVVPANVTQFGGTNGTFSGGRPEVNTSHIAGNATAATNAANGWAGLVSHAGTAQAGAAGSITLASGASSTDDYYNNSAVAIVSGTGAGQTRKITDYTGSTRVATVDTNWVTNPDNTSVYQVLGRLV